MKKQKKPTVVILYGGKGVEHDISMLGKEYLISRIDRSRYRTLEVMIDRDGEWYLKRGKRLLPTSLVRRGGKVCLLMRRGFITADTVFPMLHGDYGEDGRIQGHLEVLGVPFVGCKTHAGAVASDKCFAKAVAKSIGIPTVPWLAVNGKVTDDVAERIKTELGLPVFVKPARLGSSVGAGIAETDAELCERLRAALELGDGRAIVEKYIKAPTELECALLELGGKRIVTPPGKIRCEDGFYSFSEKYSSVSRTKGSANADVPPPLLCTVTEYARSIADALGAEGISRIDFFLTENGEIYFNEINTMPGMTESSLYPALIENFGIRAEEFIDGLIADSLGGDS